MALFGKPKDPQRALQDALRAGDHAKANQYYEAILERDPNNSQTRLRYADSLAAAGRKKEGVQQYMKVAESMASAGFLIKAIAVYKKLVALDPSREDFNRELAEMNRAREQGIEYRPPSQRAAEPAPAQEEVEPIPITTEAPEETEAVLEVQGEEHVAARAAPGAKIPLFSDLSLEEFAEVVSALHRISHAPGEVIVREGDPGDSMFVVAQGEVAVTTRSPSGKEVELATLGEGEFFGEVALLSGKSRTATITAKTDTELMELTQDDFDRIAGRFPGIRDTVQNFWKERTERTIETMIASMKGGA